MNKENIKGIFHFLIPMVLLSLLSGCTNNLLVDIYNATSPVKYTVDFEAEPEKGLIPLTVKFTEKATFTSGGEILEWRWDFDNDGVTDSTDRKPEYTYISSGPKDVVLYITTATETHKSEPKRIDVLDLTTRYTIDNDNILPFRVHFGDIDSDGDQDVVGVENFIYGITWWEHPGNESLGNGEWEPHLLNVNGIESVDGVGIARAADVDNDNDMDIIGITFTLNDNLIGNELSALNANLFLLSTAASGQDILECLQETFIAWWENVDGIGGSWIKHLVSDVFFMPWDIKVGYIDNDEYLDIISCAKYDEHDIISILNTELKRWNVFKRPETGDCCCENRSITRVDPSIENDRICWWKNPGPENKDDEWEECIIQENLDNPSQIDIADINGDGRTDVCGSEKGAGKFSWWENINSDGMTWIQHGITDGNTNTQHAYGIIAARIDPTGNIDVVTSNDWDGYIIWWKNINGNGLVWETEIISPEFNSILSLSAADNNNDNDIDLYWASFRDNQIYWWENLYDSENEVVWEDYILDYSFEHAASVCAVDFNNDGCLEVLATAAFGDIDGQLTCWWDLSEIE